MIIITVECTPLCIIFAIYLDSLKIMANRFQSLITQKDDVKKEALSLIDCGLLLSAEK